MREEPTPMPENVTRRRFIKRSGGATVGTAIGLYALQTPAWAQGGDDSSTLWEYSIKCTSDPTDIAGQTYAGFNLTDLGETYEFGNYSSHDNIDPDGLGDDASIILGLAANGPSSGDIATSHTVTGIAEAKWVNVWYDIFGYEHDQSEGPISKVSSCTVFLPDPHVPFVQATPNPQTQVSDKDGRVEAWVLVAAAFNVYGLAVYHDDGYGTASVTIGPFTYTTKKADKSYTEGPQTLSWSLVLVRRRRGSNDPWQVCPDQPDWNDLGQPEFEEE